MTGKKIAYIRVSMESQNESRQLEALENLNIDKIFSEKISGKNTNRPQLQAMLDYVREDDTIYITDFSRLARSTKDLLELVEVLNKKGVKLVSLKENLDTGTATGKLMLTVIAAINEFERANMLERQREGIAIAVRAGKYKGRKEVKPANFDEIYAKWKSRELSGTKAIQLAGCGKTTFYKLVKEMN